MNFRKSAKGGGVIFNPKIYVAHFGNFKQGFVIMKLIQIESNLRVQRMFFEQLYWEKSKQDTFWRRHFWIPILSGPHTSWHMCNYIHYKKFATYFSKNEGGVKGRLEFCQNFIRFVSGILPLIYNKVCHQKYHFRIIDIIYADKANTPFTKSIWHKKGSSTWWAGVAGCHLISIVL